MIHADFSLGWLILRCKVETPSETFLEIEKDQDINCFVDMTEMYGERR